MKKFCPFIPLWKTKVFIHNSHSRLTNLGGWVHTRVEVRGQHPGVCSCLSPSWQAGSPLSLLLACQPPGESPVSVFHLTVRALGSQMCSLASQDYRCAALHQGITGVQPCIRVLQMCNLAPGNCRCAALHQTLLHHTFYMGGRDLNSRDKAYVPSTSDH